MPQSESIRQYTDTKGWYYKDLSSIDCFHGRLEKADAVALLTQDGDFLLRMAKDKYDKVGR